MEQLDEAVEAIRSVASRRGGVADLARESGVPYTTIRSLAEHDWRPKGLDTFQRLAAAAAKLSSEAAEQSAA